MDFWTCNFCGKNTIRNKHHSKCGHIRQCEEARKVKQNITKSFLEKEYIENKRSALEISKELGFNGAKVVIEKLKEFGITTRTITESTTTDRTREKSKKTNMEKYGSPHNFCKSHPSRKGWEQRLLEEEGITNVFQRESVKEQIIKTTIEKYGATHVMQCPEIRNKLWDIMLKKYGVKYPIMLKTDKRISIPHKKVIDLMISKNILFEVEQPIDNYYVDILLRPEKKIIEIYGDFYHANPLKYKKDDLLKFPGYKGKPKIASEIWEYDEKRENYLLDKGFELLILWEKDIYKNIKLIEEKICDFLK